MFASGLLPLISRSKFRLYTISRISYFSSDCGHNGRHPELKEHHSANNSARDACPSKAWQKSSHQPLSFKACTKFTVPPHSPPLTIKSAHTLPSFNHISNFTHCESQLRQCFVATQCQRYLISSLFANQSRLLQRCDLHCLLIQRLTFMCTD